MWTNFKCYLMKTVIRCSNGIHWRNTIVKVKFSFQQINSWAWIVQRTTNQFGNSTSFSEKSNFSPRLSLFCGSWDISYSKPFSVVCAHRRAGSHFSRRSITPLPICKHSTSQKKFSPRDLRKRFVTDRVLSVLQEQHHSWRNESTRKRKFKIAFLP